LVTVAVEDKSTGAVPSVSAVLMSNARTSSGRSSVAPGTANVRVNASMSGP
jgi:hypothetical protein